jgi:hypothetical protein
MGSKAQRDDEEKCEYEGDGLVEPFFVAGICATIKHRCVTHLYLIALFLESSVISIFIKKSSK